MEKLMMIGDLARLVGVPPSTLRYYEKAGLLHPPARQSGRRDYGAEALVRLRLARRARDAGLGIAETRDLLDLCLGRGDGSNASRARTYAAEKATEVAGKIAALTMLKALLDSAAACGCEPLADCDLIHG